MKKGLTTKTLHNLQQGVPAGKLKNPLELKETLRDRHKPKIEKTVKFFTIEKKLNTLFADKLF